MSVPPKRLPKGMTVSQWRTEACKRNGPRHAIFTPVLSSRKIYKGEWKNDEKSGSGSELDVRRKLLYEGEWSHGVRSGYGELSRVMPDRSHRRIYSGDWRANKREGFGRSWYEDGGYYEGDFRANFKHGFGRIWRKDGTFYQGTWKNDVYHGEGMLVLASGNRYEGYFSDGRKNGRGIFCHVKTGQLQEGCWLDDKCVVSTMVDVYWRQSAPFPTFYPIPKNGLPNCRVNLEARIKRISMLHEPESISFAAKYDDHSRQNVERDCNE